MVNLNLGNATRIGLNLLALLGVVIALRLGESVFVPLVIALLLAALVWPAVYGLNRYLRFSWPFSCFLVVGGLVVLNVLVTLGFGMAVTRMLQNIPDLRYSDERTKAYNIVRQRLERVMTLDEEYFPTDAKKSKVFGYIEQTLQEGSYVAGLLWSVTKSTNSWVWQWVLVLFILLFLMLEGQMLSRRVVEIFGPGLEVQARAVEGLSDIATSVRTYLVWRTIVNFSVGLAVGAVYHWVFQLSQPWTWALLTAVACYVPYLGPIVAGVPPLLDAFVTTEPLYALAVLVFYIAVITVEGYVLVPVVMGRTMELNATTVMLACLFWELVWGLPGLFLAMPLMAALKTVFFHVPGGRPWANLMSTEAEEVIEGPKTVLIRTLRPPDDTEILPPEGKGAATAPFHPSPRQAP